MCLSLLLTACALIHFFLKTTVFLLSCKGLCIVVIFWIWKLNMHEYKWASTNVRFVYSEIKCDSPCDHKCPVSYSCMRCCEAPTERPPHLYFGCNLNTLTSPINPSLSCLLMTLYLHTIAVAVNTKTTCIQTGWNWNLATYDHSHILVRQSKTALPKEQNWEIMEYKI